MLTVVAAPPAMSTTAQIGLIAEAHNIIQPDTTRARTVRVAQRYTAESANVNITITVKEIV